MNKYEVQVFPNAETDTFTIEANSVEEAISQAEEIANREMYFMATPEDVELLEEGIDEMDESEEYDEEVRMTKQEDN